MEVKRDNVHRKLRFNNTNKHKWSSVTYKYVIFLNVKYQITSKIVGMFWFSPKEFNKKNEDLWSEKDNCVRKRR